MDFYGFLWMFIDFAGFLWMFIDFAGFQWMCLWILMDVNGFYNAKIAKKNEIGGMVFGIGYKPHE